MRIADKITVFFLLALLVVAAIPITAQIKARVSGLEDNAEYMSLLEEQAGLKNREDSISRVMTATRSRLRENPDQREQLAADIVRLENELFEARNASGMLSGRISAIEQEFILNNLGRPANIADTTTIGAEETPATGNNNTDVLSDDFFRLRLPAADYNALREAQRKETSVANYLRIFGNNYRTMSALADEYRYTEDAVIADSLFTQYGSLDELNMIIADSINSAWNYVVENKSYAYNYLLDRLNLMDILAEMERQSLAIRNREAAARCEYFSDIVASYPDRKRLLLDYETRFAEMLNMPNALDSLGRVAGSINDSAYLLPRIDLEERLFLDISDIEIFSPAKYNASNPIPDLQVHPKGTIYRIFVGSFAQRQPVSTFRGAYPVGVLRMDDGRYGYFLGGFASYAGADAAIADMRRAGFRNPRIAVWEDGVYTMPAVSTATVAAPGSVVYHIEIEGTNALSEEVRGLAEGRDISRVAGKFVIGIFDSATDAEEIAGQIRETDPALKVSIAEVEL